MTHSPPTTPPPLSPASVPGPPPSLPSAAPPPGLPGASGPSAAIFARPPRSASLSLSAPAQRSPTRKRTRGRREEALRSRWRSLWERGRSLTIEKGRGACFRGKTIEGEGLEAPIRGSIRPEFCACGAASSGTSAELFLGSKKNTYYFNDYYD